MNHLIKFAFRISPFMSDIANTFFCLPALGFFLQCQPLYHSIGCKDVVDSKWTCTAKAELKIKSHKAGGQDFSRQIKHNFCAADYDWGFSQIMVFEVYYDNLC